MLSELELDAVILPLASPGKRVLLLLCALLSAFAGWAESGLTTILYLTTIRAELSSPSRSAKCTRLVRSQLASQLSRPKREIDRRETNRQTDRRREREREIHFSQPVSQSFAVQWNATKIKREAKNSQYILNEMCVCACSWSESVSHSHGVDSEP